jgi:hypothetical protein
MESPCPFHARARSASMDCPWTRIVPGLCAVVARTASRLANRMPTRPLCDLLRGLHRHLPGHLPTVARTFIDCCMGRFPPTARTLRGCCPDASPDAARALRELLRGRCATCQSSASCLPSGLLPDLLTLMLTWLLRDVLRQMPTMLPTEMPTLISLRGWCLSKMFRFSISENRRHLHSIERIKLGDGWRSERSFLKSERTEQMWSRGILETDVDCAAV